MSCEFGCVEITDRLGLPRAQCCAGIRVFQDHPPHLLDVMSDCASEFLRPHVRAGRHVVRDLRTIRERKEASTNRRERVRVMPIRLRTDPTASRSNSILSAINSPKSLKPCASLPPIIVSATHHLDVETSREPLALTLVVMWREPCAVANVRVMRVRSRSSRKVVTLLPL